MTDDLVLLGQYARTRDANAFAELVRRYAGLVYGVCLRVTKSHHDAEDVAQECFLSLARGAGSVNSSLPGWLHALAASRATDAVRKAATRRRHEESAMKEELGQEEATWEEVGAHIDHALAELPENLRTPLVLHYLLGYSQPEVASPCLRQWRGIRGHGGDTLHVREVAGHRPGHARPQEGEEHVAVRAPQSGFAADAPAGREGYVALPARDGYQVVHVEAGAVAGRELLRFCGECSGGNRSAFL